jgi:hypothetical protein
MSLNVCNIRVHTLEASLSIVTRSAVGRPRARNRCQCQRDPLTTNSTSSSIFPHVMSSTHITANEKWNKKCFRWYNPKSACVAAYVTEVDQFYTWRRKFIRVRVLLLCMRVVWCTTGFFIFTIWGGEDVNQETFHDLCASGGSKVCLNFDKNCISCTLKGG